MYAVTKEGTLDGYSDSVVFIKLHQNGCYVPCDEAGADGFCAKIAREMTLEDGASITMPIDTVYCFDGKTLHGSEPTGSCEQINGAALLLDSENSAAAMSAQLAELEAAYDEQ